MSTGLEMAKSKLARKTLYLLMYLDKIWRDGKLQFKYVENMHASEVTDRIVGPCNKLAIIMRPLCFVWYSMKDEESNVGFTTLTLTYPNPLTLFGRAWLG